MKRLTLFLACASLALQAQNYTRGIGVYPGDPKEYTGPALVDRRERLSQPGAASARISVERLRLQPDGAIDHGRHQGDCAAAVDRTSTSDAGILPKNEREVFLDGNVTSSVNVTGDSPWVEFDIKGGSEAPEIDRIDLYLRKIYGRSAIRDWTYMVLGSDDRQRWKEVGRASRLRSGRTCAGPGPSFHADDCVCRARAISFVSRAVSAAANLRAWGWRKLALFDKGQEVRVAGPDAFCECLDERGERRGVGLCGPGRGLHLRSHCA